MHQIERKSIRRWAIVGCLAAACTGCGVIHERFAGDAYGPPNGQDQAAADYGDQSPPYPHFPSLHPVPTHPVFLPLSPTGSRGCRPTSAPANAGAVPVGEGPQIQIVPPTAEEVPAPLPAKRSDRVTQNAPRPASDPDAPSWLFQPNEIASVPASGQGSRKSDRDGELIRR